MVSDKIWIDYNVVTIVHRFSISSSPFLEFSDRPTAADDENPQDLSGEGDFVTPNGESTTTKSLESSGEEDSTTTPENSGGREASVDPAHINTDIPDLVDKHKNVGAPVKHSLSVFRTQEAPKENLSRESSNVKLTSHEHGISGTYVAKANSHNTGQKVSAFCAKMSLIKFKHICR